MESGDEANNELLQETEPFTNILLEGTNSSRLHEGQKVLFEDAGADYLSTETTISTATASAKILDVDIAKASFSLGTTAEKTGSFSGIESLIGEELIRIQDSFYYQQFSYEIQSSRGGSAYLNELRKAVHPAGFNVFSKVVQSTSVSARITVASFDDTTDIDSGTYDAILSTTFLSIFSDPVQRRLGVLAEGEDIILEDSISQPDGNNFTLEDETGVGIIQMETPENAYSDFEAIIISYGTGAGEFGILITEGLDRIVSESAEVISNNLVFDGTEDGHLSTSQDDAGSDILTEDGDSIVFEEAIQEGISFLLGEDKSIINKLLDETDGESIISEFANVDSDSDIFLQQSITIKVSAGVSVATPNGLEFLATKNIDAITGDGIELEVGTDQKGSRLLLTQTDNSASDLGDHILLEAASDFNVNQGVTRDTFTLIKNDKFVLEDGTGFLVLENPVGFHGGGAILQEEDLVINSHTSKDFNRDSLVFFPNENDGLIDDTIILEGQEIGTYKLEDGTTVATTFGGDLLLEDYTGFGVGGKLQLERTFIVLEDSLNTGMPQFNISGATILEPFTTPSDIFVNTIGKLTAEDDYDFIVFNTEADENDQIILENGTEIDLYIQSIVNAPPSTDFSFASIDLTFDSNLSFDINDINRIKED
jgi:hypothetical protein